MFRKEVYLTVLALGSKVLIVGRWELQGWPLEEDIIILSDYNHVLQLDRANFSPLCNGLTGEHSEPISYCGHFGKIYVRRTNRSEGGAEKNL